VLDIIKHGVRIPFLQLPPPIFRTNNRSAVCTDNIAWVRSTIAEYLDAGFVLKVTQQPYCVMPLQVKTGTTKNSLIYDMTALNAFVDTNKFKLETWPEMFSYASQSSFGIKFDIKKYYYNIDLAPDHYKYFGFTFVLQEGGGSEIFCLDHPTVWLQARTVHCTAHYETSDW
jgi:hypothetical protein